VIVRLVSDAELARESDPGDLLKTFKGLGTFSGDSSFYTWLYPDRAGNVVTSHLRYEAARPKVSASLDAETGDRPALSLVPTARARSGPGRGRCRAQEAPLQARRAAAA